MPPAAGDIVIGSSEKKKRYGAAGVMAVVASAALVVALLPNPNQTSGLLRAGAANVGTGTSSLASLSSEEQAAFSEVFDIVTSMPDSQVITCKNVDYAYCGSATCTALNRETAACGCYVEEAASGQFAFSTASLVLIKSPIYRSAAFALKQGALDEEAFCGSLRDGSLFTTAGFGSGFGSFFHPVTQVENSVESSPAASRRSHFAGADETVTGTMASCMGAPCKMHDWGGGCEATCICTSYQFTSTVTESPSSSEEIDSCFFNTASNSDASLPWTKDIDTLMLYVGKIAEAAPLLKGKLLGTESSCMGTCSVEPRR